MDGVLLYIAKQQEEDGAGVGLHMPIAYKRMYLNSLSEGVFYLNAIKADGLTILVTNWVANRGREI